MNPSDRESGTRRIGLRAICTGAPVTGAGDNVNGQVTIVRTTSNVQEDYITLYVHIDGEEVRAEMTLENFAMAVTGMSRVPATVERRDRRG